MCVLVNVCVCVCVCVKEGRDTERESNIVHIIVMLTDLIVCTLLLVIKRLEPLARSIINAMLLLLLL